VLKEREEEERKATEGTDGVQKEGEEKEKTCANQSQLEP